MTPSRRRSAGRAEQRAGIVALAALPTIQPRTGIEAKVRQLDADGSLTSRGSRLRAQAAPFGGAAGEHDGSCERRAQAGGSRIGGMTGAHSEVRAEPAAPRAGNTRGLQGVGVARLGDGQPPTMRELGGSPATRCHLPSSSEELRDARRVIYLSPAWRDGQCGRYVLVASATRTCTWSRRVAIRRVVQARLGRPGRVARWPRRWRRCGTAAVARRLSRCPRLT